MGSPKLWLRDAISLGASGVYRLTRRNADPNVRVLVYHSVADIPDARDPWRMSVSPRLLSAHLGWLRANGYVPVPLIEALEMVQGTRPIPGRAVAITFDDGFVDLLARAHPILRKEGIPATVFVVPGVLSKPAFPWLDDGDVFGRPLTWEELRALADDPLISIGSHGWSHRRLARLAVKEQEEEVRRSRDALEDTLGVPVTSFAYPYGDRSSFSSDTVECLQRAGYVVACTNVMGTNRPGDSAWTIARTRIDRKDSLWRFRLKMRGACDWADQPVVGALAGTLASAGFGAGTRPRCP